MLNHVIGVLEKVRQMATEVVCNLALEFTAWSGNHEIREGLDAN